MVIVLDEALDVDNEVMSAEHLADWAHSQLEIVESLYEKCGSSPSNAALLTELEKSLRFMRSFLSLEDENISPEIRKNFLANMNSISLIIANLEVVTEPDEVIAAQTELMDSICELNDTAKAVNLMRLWRWHNMALVRLSKVQSLIPEQTNVTGDVLIANIRKIAYLALEGIFLEDDQMIVKTKELDDILAGWCRFEHSIGNNLTTASKMANDGHISCLEVSSDIVLEEQMLQLPGEKQPPERQALSAWVDMEHDNATALLDECELTWVEEELILNIQEALNTIHDFLITGREEELDPATMEELHYKVSTLSFIISKFDTEEDDLCAEERELIQILYTTNDPAQAISLMQMWRLKYMAKLRKEKTQAILQNHSPNIIDDIKSIQSIRDLLLAGLKNALFYKDKIIIKWEDLYAIINHWTSFLQAISHNLDIAKRSAIRVGGLAASCAQPPQDAFQIPEY